jgi:hypothetical protein
LIGSSAGTFGSLFPCGEKAIAEPRHYSHRSNSDKHDNNRPAATHQDRLMASQFHPFGSRLLFCDEWMNEMKARLYAVLRPY